MLANDKKSLLSLIDKVIARSARLSETHAPGRSETLYLCHVISGGGRFGRPLKATANARDWLAVEIRSIVVASNGGDEHWLALAMPHQLIADLNNRVEDVRVESMLHAPDDWDRACDETQMLRDTTANCFRLGVLHALRVKAEQLPEEETHHG